MGRSKKKKGTSAAGKKADELCRKLKPQIVEMIERNDPAVAGLDINQIEANSAAVGDLLAKVAMRDALEKHADTMNYPEYRAKGWPIGSGSVESACGQFGDRVKHSRMRWTRNGADALVAQWRPAAGHHERYRDLFACLSTDRQSPRWSRE